MFNSIITTHRNRIGSLRAFLRSIFIASKYSNEKFEIVISDLQKDFESKKIIEEYSDRLLIKHLHHPDYNGVFWKTKCINHAVLNSLGYYITHLDVDAVVTPMFLNFIEEFYEKIDNKRAKLAHRVRFLNKQMSDEASKGLFDENFLNRIIQNYRASKLAKERYTLNTVVNTKENVPLEWSNGMALGNSHFTMNKEDFVSMGGMDEDMIGWGSEDTDFNWRSFRFLKGGYINTSPQYNVYDITHPKDWSNKIWYDAGHKKKCIYI